MTEKMGMAVSSGETFDGGVTEAQIEKWKRQWGKVVRVDILDGADLHIGYFHRPKLEAMSAVAKIAKTDEVKGSEVMFDNCWLGGSDAMRKDAILFMEAAKQLGQMLSSCQSSLKNL